MKVYRLSDVLDEVILKEQLPVLLVNDLRCWHSSRSGIRYTERERQIWIRLDGKYGAVFSFSPAFIFNPLCYKDMWGYSLKKDSGNYMRCIPYYNDGLRF